MDIKPPPRRPVPPPVDPVLPAPVESRELAPEPAGMKTVLANRRKAKQRKLLLVIGGALLVSFATFAMWYVSALSPRDPSDARHIRFVVESGEGSASIASELQSHELIKSAVAFQIYAELTGTKAKLQAGGFALSPSMSVKEIVDHIVKGNTDDLTVLVLPGLTLSEQADPDVKNSLAAQGFDPDEIQSAFETVYDHPLLEGRPAGEGIEGFIFPETYRIRASDPLSVLIKKSFDEVHARLQEDGMIAKFHTQGLNLYQAFTLASIVQKEVSNPEDQKQVAQVFLKRLKEGMVLGSDVTFFYAAKQLGVEPSVNLDSPYNTRRYGGLPPGPISNMNYSALQAVAEPAPGDYLYFVAGDGDDEGKTFFARTEAEHLANVAAHCHTLCN